MTIEQDPGNASHPHVELARWDMEVRRQNAWEWIAGTVCLLIGVTLILNIHPIGDGMWFWYALDLRHGIRLYQDLHLALQPLYVLCTAAFQELLGTGWLASKVFPFLQLLGLTFLLLRLSRAVPWANWQRALLAITAFLFIVQPSTYRFDDYHVTSDLFTLGSLLLLERLGSRSRDRRSLALFAFLIGLCCGLAGMTRLNDGAALVIAAALILLLLYPPKALVTLAGLVAGTVTTVLIVLVAVHARPRDWWHDSIAGAGAIKGGTGNILYTPLLLPWHLWLNMQSWRLPVTVALVCGLFLAVRGTEQRIQRHDRWGVYAVGWGTMLLLLTFALVHRSQVQTPLELLVRLSILLLLGAAGALLVWSTVRWLRGCSLLPQAQIALLLLPLMHLLGGALTASNALPDPYLSLAMLMLIAPSLLPRERAHRWALPLLANLSLLAAIIAAAKVQHPYYWWTYDDGPVYRDRTWYRHPELGLMYIERPQLALMRQLCDRVRASDAPAELLSMPFPYANYFCGAPPWHDYVQTWYDTTSAATVHTLMDQLQAAPPHWIAYEYDPVAVIGHEITYYHGRPMAHRALKDLVTDKIETGAWTLRQHACSRMSEWLLVETVRVPDEQNTLRAGFKPEGGVCH